MPNWNPIQYEKFIKDRTQPAVDLANRLEALNPTSILDLGCGPGNSTKVLKDKFPNARIVGTDNGILLLEARQVLSTCIDAPVAEETGYLSTHLLVGLEVLVPKGDAMIIRQSPTTIQLHGGIKLPLTQAWGEGCCEQTLITAVHRLLS